ncbi:MAG: DUF1573 domain-containing protein, partial [Saprospiraceae bacterium]
MKWSDLYILLMLMSLTYSCNPIAKETHFSKEVVLPGEEIVVLPKTELTFVTRKKNLGKIKDTETVPYIFKFKNTGIHPAYIKQAKPSCTCTVATYPQNAIAPGAQSEIEIYFKPNSVTANKTELQSSSVELIG